MLYLYLNKKRGGAAVRKFLRKYWYIVLPLILIYTMLALQYPFLWGIWNAELAIGLWLGLGYSITQAFLMACAFGNVECCVWYVFIGKAVAKRKKQIAERIAVEAREARQAGMEYHVRSFWEYLLEQLEPEQYATHWAYRLLMYIAHSRIIGFALTLFLYIIITALCVVPVVKFPVMVFVHATKMRAGLIPILIGNTCMIALFAYGAWPIVFSAIKSVWSAF